MSISWDAWERRKLFVHFTDDDAALLKSMQSAVEKKVDGVVDKLYAHWMEAPELEEFLADPDLLARLKATQKQYFLQLFSGDYGQDYLESRIRVGQAHQRIGLDVQWYIGAFSNYIEYITPIILDSQKKDTAKAQKALLALIKLINLDQEIAILTYINAREEVIEKQHEEILELSTPVVRVWDGVVAAPIIGTLDSHRTQMFMERLLETIVETKSPVALVDITGVPAIDTATAQHLIDTINSVKLLGATVIITGVSPAIAQTLVHLGIDLTGVLTRSALADGLAVALETLNLQITRKG